MSITENINPGIRRTVEWLNANGFKTCDSGDGATHEFECDRPCAYVVIRVVPEVLITETARLAELLRSRGVEVGDLNEEGTTPFIQGAYVPGSAAEATIDMQNVDDAMLFGDAKEAPTSSSSTMLGYGAEMMAEWALVRDKLLKASPRDAPALIRVMRRLSDLLDALGTPKENWAAFALGQSIIGAHPVTRERDEARALLATLREAADPVRAMLVDPTDGLLCPPETMAARVLSHGWAFVNAIEPLRRALDVTRAPVSDLFARCRAETIRRAERAIFALSLRADCTFENAQAIGWCQATVLSLEEQSDPAPSHPLAEVRIDLARDPRSIAKAIGYRAPRIVVLVTRTERERAKTIVKDTNVKVIVPGDPILALRIEHLVRTPGAVGTVEWETRVLNTRLVKDSTVTVIEIDKLEETLVGLLRDEPETGR